MNKHIANFKGGVCQVCRATTEQDCTGFPLAAVLQTDEEVSLVVDALKELLEVKEKALKIALREYEGAPPFTSDDFGIPDIDALKARLWALL